MFGGVRRVIVCAQIAMPLNWGKEVLGKAHPNKRVSLHRWQGHFGGPTDALLRAAMFIQARSKYCP